MLAACIATPAIAQSFKPCDDAQSAPLLAGSLCAFAKAPLDPQVKNGPEVELFVRKFPAPVPRRRHGEIWLAAGGPGEAGASFYPVLPVLRRAFPDYDLIIPDHRGTGYSAKLCPAQEAADSPAGISLAGDEWAPCLGFMHANAPRSRAFTITNASHDLSALISRYRQPGRVYVYGVSYGTQLVLRMMQTAPVRLDGIILDGMVPAEADASLDLSHRTQVVDAVGRATLTADQVDRYRALLAQKEPAWIGDVPGRDLRRFMGRLLNFPQLRARIPAIIDGLSRNDRAPLTQAVAALQVELAQLNAFPQSPPSLPLVMLISGSENNVRRNLTTATVADEEKGALFTSPLPGFLVGTPVPLYTRDAFHGQVPRHLPRTLVIQGTLDPNTPYDGAKAHARILSAAGERITLSTVEGGAHFLALVAPDCFVKAASAFVGKRMPPARCLTGTPPAGAAPPAN
ncbi:alpha/beta fold hydrolase [Sphingomonas pituitosa]|uniref:alpha/beta fold hydrolase n=1 Tax=Sphingomonas pituitosa TaxID=99597 RepID=UPI000ABC9AA7|nr:alpha/beta hydrolase [Sphingomonas pituitosa]